MESNEAGEVFSLAFEIVCIGNADSCFIRFVLQVIYNLEMQSCHTVISDSLSITTRSLGDHVLHLRDSFQLLLR
jgi:hypothetical protein